MSDDELVRRMQARADAMRDQPIELILANAPGPYRLPKCTTAGLNVPYPHRPELILDTENGQRILIELDPEALEALGDLISLALGRISR
jgi:hypothetical protein